ncbi:MAG: M1 family aminopeptidase [Acidobacteria bacterium]|nr:M1 family aminopeptidase [Acidobacteriota bacterium]
MSTRPLQRLTLLVALVAVAAPASAQRLSGQVVPEHYTLWFAPDLEAATFQGRESIRVELRSASLSITLHAAELEFRDVTIEAAGLTQAARVTFDTTAETATLTVPQPVPAGLATIHIDFTGTLNDRLRGFYLSRANDRSYAVTQMEPTDARRAFPSFDEPAYKATFDISLTIDEGDTAISNGAQLSDTPGPEPATHTVTFATTPTMSTYLVAMIVGDFVCRSGEADATPIRICSTPDKLELTRYALDAAEQQLAFYNDYFGIPYPFGKLDIIAVPDFSAGAMENSGAIVFRERLLLVDPERASLGTQKGVASIISHELAHQWFGNLVTMQWWNDIWLNEGFATWIASRPLAAWRPDWRVDLDDAADTQRAMGIDALQSTRAIRMAVNTPDEISEVFDGIAYEKTAGVLRMVEHFIGADLFRTGVVSYLQKHAYGNAAGEDCWNEMTRVSGYPVDRIMQSYIEQPGVPVVSVRTQCTDSQADIALSQERFVESLVPSSPGGQTWTVPVCLSSPDDDTRCQVLDVRQQTRSASACGPTFANADARGYYLTEYAPDAVPALGRESASASPVERLSLLGDEWWMVRAGRHEIGVYLDLAAALADDETTAVTDAIASRLAFAGTYLVDAAQHASYQEWIRSRFGPSLDALELPGRLDDTDERQSRRAALLGLIGGTGNDAQLQRRARELATGYLADPSSLPGTLVSTVLRVAAAGGDAEFYDAYLAKLDGLAANPEEYYRFFAALASFGDPALVQRTLEFAVSPDVRSQDTATLIGGLLGRPASRDAAWAFVQDEWPTLTQRLGTFQGIPGIIRALGSFCSTEAAAQVAEFFRHNAVASAERTLRQALERMDNCAALVARQSSALTSWLTATVR